MKTHAPEPHGRGVHEVTLLDGAVVTLRRLMKRDTDAVIALHSQLSDRERYFRFFCIHPPYMERFAKKVVERSARNYAVGAFKGDELIGVANYVRSGESDTAEFAVAVAHKDHLHGVGTALLRHLADVARRRNIRFFTADILAENDLMLQVVRDLGWQCTKRFDGSVLHARIDMSAVGGGSSGAAHIPSAG